MGLRMKSVLRAIPLYASIGWFGACSAPPQPAAPAPDTSKPIQVQPSAMFQSDPNQEWNIFPDPTTGEVGVYHKGDYVGSITGNETEDPPTPHKTQPGEDSSGGDSD
jgi:hypothetical protein